MAETETRARRKLPLWLRIALGIVVAAFVLVGAFGMVLMVRYARERAERAGAFHAAFVASAGSGSQSSSESTAAASASSSNARVFALALSGFALWLRFRS